MQIVDNFLLNLATDIELKLKNPNTYIAIAFRYFLPEKNDWIWTIILPIQLAYLFSILLSIRNTDYIEIPRNMSCINGHVQS